MQCPHCDAEIDYVRYSSDVSGREYGRQYLPHDECDMECDETEWTDTHDTYYSCPECDAEISYSQLEEMAEQHRLENQSESPEDRVRIVNPNHRRFRDNLIGADSVECPNCHHFYNDEYQDEMICPSCSETWEPTEEQYPRPQPQPEAMTVEETLNAAGQVTHRFVISPNGMQSSYPTGFNHGAS